jgi:hypothetical protein
MGCSSDEAAGIVGARAASTVRSRVNRARVALAAALCEDLPAATGAQRNAKICGLYHAPPEKAIVVALVEGGVNGAGSRRGRSMRARRPRVALAEADGAGRPRSFVRPSVAVGCATASDIREGHDLIDFFDQVDGHVPLGTQLLAIVDSPDTAADAGWRHSHPHWELLRAPPSGSWREEAERLLARCVPCPAQQSAGRALALLDADKPFIWTHNHSGAVL